VHRAPVWRSTHRHVCGAAAGRFPATLLRGAGLRASSNATGISRTCLMRGAGPLIFMRSTRANAQRSISSSALAVIRVRPSRHLASTVGRLTPANLANSARLRLSRLMIRAYSLLSIGAGLSNRIACYISPTLALGNTIVQLEQVAIILTLGFACGGPVTGRGGTPFSLIGSGMFHLSVCCRTATLSNKSQCPTR